MNEKRKRKFIYYYYSIVCFFRHFYFRKYTSSSRQTILFHINYIFIALLFTVEANGLYATMIDNLTDVSPIIINNCFSRFIYLLLLPFSLVHLTIFGYQLPFPTSRKIHSSSLADDYIFLLSQFFVVVYSRVLFIPLHLLKYGCV